MGRAKVLVKWGTKMHDSNHDLIELREIVQIVKENIKLIVIFPIIFAIIGALISIYLIDDVYESSTTIMVRQNKSTDKIMNIVDVNLSKSLVYTYAEMAKSNMVIENAKKELNFNKLNSNSIKVTHVNNTQILKMSVKNTNPQLVVNIADALAEKFTMEITRIIGTDNVAVIDYAWFPKNLVKPNKMLNTVFCAILGEMMILFIIFIREYFNNTIKSEKDIERYIKMPAIGTIPNFKQGGGRTYGY